MKILTQIRKGILFIATKHNPFLSISHIHVKPALCLVDNTGPADPDLMNLYRQVQGQGQTLYQKRKIL